MIKKDMHKYNSLKQINCALIVSAYTRRICLTRESLALSVMLPTNTVVFAFISATETG